MASLINFDELSKQLQDTLNAGMLEAAEPHIQAALVLIEERMRQEMRAMLVRYLDRVVSMERFGSDLRIIIREQPGNSL